MPLSHFVVPAKQPTAIVEGKIRPLAANFSAPISYYEPPRQSVAGRSNGGITIQLITMDKTGLYFLQPYDPDRIPVVFVHGLISTPFDWVQTINGLQADPEIRKHYQFWIFAYPTGNPDPLFRITIARRTGQSRQTLSGSSSLYPVSATVWGECLLAAQGYESTALIGSKHWGKPAKQLFAKIPAIDLDCSKATTFKANSSDQTRCLHLYSPSREQDGQSGGSGRFGTSLIALPLNIATTMKDDTHQRRTCALTGSSKRLPNSVSGLKPSNPAVSPVINSASIHGSLSLDHR